VCKRMGLTGPAPAVPRQQHPLTLTGRRACAMSIGNVGATRPPSLSIEPAREGSGYISCAPYGARAVIDVWNSSQWNCPSWRRAPVCNKPREILTISSAAPGDGRTAALCPFPSGLPQAV
jgi:hypothetical protein